jgi:hypothetical protein
MNSNDEKEKIDALKLDLRNAAKDILDDVFDKEKINIIAAPGDSPLCIHAAAAGKLLIGVVQSLVTDKLRVPYSHGPDRATSI